ncbi:hypothetical protein L1887_34102 [Cichorium endivia]|nr:hypothetical protein L1887_34102 [Cichorium endivia]
MKVSRPFTNAISTAALHLDRLFSLSRVAVQTIRSDFKEHKGLKSIVALKILTRLDDSADLVRASAVSHHWQNFVISNGLSKQLCLKRFPQLASITHDPSSGDVAYAALFQALTKFPKSSCIADPVSASSTDNYPEESILNTLDPRDKILHRDSYWSSEGSDDPEKSETLIYNLTANFCVISEIHLHPFQASFQLDLPIYSSRYVQFNMGHPKSWSEIDQDFMESQECADDKFVWTYTSQMFPMAQENRLQKFKLPEPVICIGGVLQIELIGRVQKQEVDGKYYICLTHVQAIGRQLSPAFCVEISGPSNDVSLTYDAKEFEVTMKHVYDGLSKQLCLKRFPQLASITHDPSSGDVAYTSLFQALTKFPQSYCIADPVSASSTDNYPEESILNTLNPRDKILNRDSYWSSTGSDDQEKPETLIYNLTANFCVISEIYLRPFQASFQMDFPIYSSRYVRFKMGHPKSWSEIDHDFMESQECADDKFVWTYTSQMFPMAQENRLQRFKLPEPVVCIGGFLQIEFIGRVQKQAVDGKYYICVAHLQAIGRRLSPAFSVEISGPSNDVSLTYDAEEFEVMIQRVSSGDNGYFSS